MWWGWGGGNAIPFTVELLNTYYYIRLHRVFIRGRQHDFKVSGGVGHIIYIYIVHYIKQGTFFYG